MLAFCSVRLYYACGYKNLCFSQSRHRYLLVRRDTWFTVNELPQTSQVLCLCYYTLPLRVNHTHFEDIPAWPNSSDSFVAIEWDVKFVIVIGPRGFVVIQKYSGAYWTVCRSQNHMVLFCFTKSEDHSFVHFITLKCSSWFYTIFVIYGNLRVNCRNSFYITWQLWYALWC